ncbi:MAG: hypothetical protein LBN39_11410, partial [Planctomycetaceae bacterium]|nr:hypothetical protein [Planctomycetaceae bacterium]
MPLDPYSLCPGGREKKIRFCCPDLVKEIEQIERLLSSNQGGACLSLIESLEKEHENCACLKAAKLSVYRTENRWDDALPFAESFLKSEPENPVAAAEYALALTVGGQPQQSLNVLVDAFERAKEGTAHSALINAALQIGVNLLMQGFILPAMALGHQLKRIPAVQEPANSLLLRASSLDGVPILLRDMLFEYGCPDDFPGKEEFEDAVESIALMRWKSGLAKLESLSKYAPQWSQIWRNIAAVRFWLLDETGGCDALRTYAELPNTLPEDAADAEATRFLLSTDPLGDHTELQAIEYPVTDAEKVYEILLSAPEFYPARVNLPPDGNTPPPKGAFFILDRPVLKTPPPQWTLGNTPIQVAACMLFGKETDRNARLIIPEIVKEDRALAEELLKRTLGDFIGEAATVQKIRDTSLTFAKVNPHFGFSAEAMPVPEIGERLITEYLDQTFADFWCSLPLGIFEGKTPEEAAKEPKYRNVLAGAVTVLEFWIRFQNIFAWSNCLRKRLGLPEQGRIPVADGSTEEQMLALLDELPIWRWYRLEVEKLTTDTLEEGLQIVSVLAEPNAIKRFAEEILNRPSNTMEPQVRQIAFELLITIAKNRSEE